MTTLSILNGRGDTKLTWDPNDPDQCATARQTVAALARQGYRFFLMDGNPADEVTAGAGMLVVRKMTADELIPGIDDRLDPDIATCLPEGKPGDIEAVEGPPAPKRRGRPPKAKMKASTKPDTHVVAVRPLAGG